MFYRPEYWYIPVVIDSVFFMRVELYVFGLRLARWTRYR